MRTLLFVIVALATLAAVAGYAGLYDVAFLQKLPRLDAKGYRDLVAKASMHEQAAPGHSYAADIACKCKANLD